VRWYLRSLDGHHIGSLHRQLALRVAEPACLAGLMIAILNHLLLLQELRVHRDELVYLRFDHVLVAASAPTWNRARRLDRHEELRGLLHRVALEGLLEVRLVGVGLVVRVLAILPEA